MSSIKPFQPLLASPAPEDLGLLKYPLYGSPKYDGVRALVRGFTLLSRQLKPIRNQLLQHLLGKPEFEGLDGELICGDPTAKDVFQRSQAMCATADASVEGAIFFVFDCTNQLQAPFDERHQEVRSILGSDQVVYQGVGLSRVRQALIKDEAQLLQVESQVVSLGFEGLMLRSRDGKYKLGRSTAKEGILLKLKRFAHDEAEVFGAYEQLHNANTATKDARGYTQRSSHQENMVGKGTLGGFHVKMVTGEFKGIAVDVGTGWTDAERAELWEAWHRQGLKSFNRARGLMRVKHQLAGSKDRPRFPVFDGWRSRDD